MDYTRKLVFIGIDVHKNTYTIAVLHQYEILDKVTMKADPKEFVRFIKKRYEGAKVKCAYEAGFSGFHLHYCLQEAGFDNIVVHPASIEVSSRDRVKTDKRDALKIAIQLESGRLKGIYVPTKERLGFRSITRLREQITIKRKKTGNQIKSLLHQHGLIQAGDSRKISKSWIEWVLTLSLDENIHYCLKMLISQWLLLGNEIAEIDRKLKKQAKNDEKLEKIYQSVPGVGPGTSRVLSNELGDMSQFKNEKQLYSFTGLTPCEYSSGEHRRQGHISRQGRSILRKTLILCAWNAVRKDFELKNTYEELGRRIGKKRAIVAIARRLVGRMRACINKGTLYKIAA